MPFQNKAAAQVRLTAECSENKPCQKNMSRLGGMNLTHCGDECVEMYFIGTNSKAKNTDLFFVVCLKGQVSPCMLLL